MAVARTSAPAKWCRETAAVARQAGLRLVARELERAVERYGHGFELTEEEVRALAQILPDDERVAQLLADADAASTRDSERRARLRELTKKWPRETNRDA